VLFVTRRVIESKAFASSDDLDSDEAFSPCSTLGEYEVEEVSLGKAAKLLRKSGRHGSENRSAVDVDSEAEESAGYVPRWRILLDHQDPSYEVEEIQPASLETWMSDKVRQEQGDCES
jgi:hypothetical protein